MAYAIHPRNMQSSTASGLDVLAGLWLLISPFALNFTMTANPTTNNIIVGIIVTCLAAIRLFGAYAQGWLSWINALLGLWTLITPWVLGFAGYSVPTTNNVLTGIAIIILGSWSAMASVPTKTEMTDINPVV